MNSQLRINITKGSGIGGYGVRNYQFFENAYGVNNVGTVKTELTVGMKAWTALETRN